MPFLEGVRASQHWGADAGRGRGHTLGWVRVRCPWACSVRGRAVLAPGGRRFAPRGTGRKWEVHGVLPGDPGKKWAPAARSDFAGTSPSSVLPFLPHWRPECVLPLLLLPPRFTGRARSPSQGARSSALKTGSSHVRPVFLSGWRTGWCGRTVLYKVDVGFDIELPAEAEATRNRVAVNAGSRGPPTQRARAHWKRR